MPLQFGTKAFRLYLDIVDAIGNDERNKFDIIADLIDGYAEECEREKDELRKVIQGKDALIARVTNAENREPRRWGDSLDL